MESIRAPPQRRPPVARDPPAQAKDGCCACSLPPALPSPGSPRPPTTAHGEPPVPTNPIAIYSNAPTPSGRGLLALQHVCVWCVIEAPLDLNLARPSPPRRIDFHGQPNENITHSYTHTTYNDRTAHVSKRFPSADRFLSPTCSAAPRFVKAFGLAPLDAETLPQFGQRAPVLRHWQPSSLAPTSTAATRSRTGQCPTYTWSQCYPASTST
jgi:hypothetical protein